MSNIQNELRKTDKLLLLQAELDSLSRRLDIVEVTSGFTTEERQSMLIKERQLLNTIREEKAKLGI